MVLVAVFYLCVHKIKDHPKMQNVDDFNMKYRHAGRQTSGCGATKCLETLGARSI